MKSRLTVTVRVALLFGFVSLVLQIDPCGRWADAAGNELIPLPGTEKWTPQLADTELSGEATELRVPINYKIGRTVSPVIPVEAGDLLTFAADVQTRFAGSQQSFYRCWLEMEFLRETQVVATARSPELMGTHEAPQLLAITAAAPKGASSLRLSICAQNKFWSILDNQATVSNVRLLRLASDGGGTLQIKISATLPKRSGERAANLVLRGDLPDGTAVAVSTSRGVTVPTALLSGGRAEIAVRYDANDVGAAVVTARVQDQEVSTRLVDPLAATLQIRSIHADGLETPALVQLIRDEVMMPGRYQQSMPGIFMTAPWSIDLAPGRWRLRVCRGPEFEALEQTIEAKSGETITRERLQLARHVDLRPSGWYGGDADGDVYHGEQIYTDVTAGTAAEIAQAMGLDWVGVGSWRKPDPKTWAEAHTVMQRLSRPNFLFLWSDEKPKSREGHVCLVGIDRPDDEPFGWGWTGAKRRLRNFELLQVIRSSGAATFVNHPLRWWTSGDRFATNMYASLPFDLCAAGLLDGYNVNEKKQDIEVWSMLLDRGYRVAATAGADFCLDRPSGPPPGKSRMYCYCPDGLTGPALAEAVRNNHTIVSTGPILVADIDGRPPGSTFQTGHTYAIRAKAWARADDSDSLQRIELWTHGKAITTKTYDGNTKAAEETFLWQPEGDWDWIAVRAVSRRGWAMTSAFYATGSGWQPPHQPVQCRLTLDISGLNAQQLKKTTVEVWDNVPALVTSRKLMEQAFADGAPITVPVSGTVVVSAPGGRKREVSVYDAVGMSEHVERIASGAERERPLLDWKTYESVLRLCREARVTVEF